MTASKKSTATEWVDPDDAPDLSQPEWVEKFAAIPVKRGRPRVAAPKKTVAIRLSPDVLAALKATGKGWQTRVEQTLRASLGL